MPQNTQNAQSQRLLSGADDLFPMKPGEHIPGGPYYRVRLAVAPDLDPSVPRVVQLYLVHTPDRRQCVRAVHARRDEDYPAQHWPYRRIVWMRRSEERRDVTLLRLGAQYERLDQLGRDRATLERKQDVEEWIQFHAGQMIAFEEGWPEMWVVRGRNVIRKARGQELVHV